MTVYWMYHCNGRNPRTGKRVGERHRWPDGHGRGYCKFCGRTIDQLRYPAPENIQQAERRRRLDYEATRRDAAE